MVPAVCDGVAGRGEFWSPCIAIGSASTTGAYQPLFEYDRAWAAGQALLMAVRASRRSRILVADTVAPNRRQQFATRLPDGVDVELVARGPARGAVDPEDLQAP